MKFEAYDVRQNICVTLIFRCLACTASFSETGRVYGTCIPPRASFQFSENSKCVCRCDNVGIYHVADPELQFSSPSSSFFRLDSFRQVEGEIVKCQSSFDAFAAM
jgi:hypothetical protein